MAAPPPGRRHQGTPRVADRPEKPEGSPPQARGQEGRENGPWRAGVREPAGCRVARPLAQGRPVRSLALAGPPRSPADRGRPRPGDPAPRRDPHPRRPIRAPPAGPMRRRTRPATPSRTDAATGGARRPLRCRREPTAGGRSPEPAPATRRRPGPTPIPDPRRRVRAPRTPPGPDRVWPEAPGPPRRRAGRGPERTPRRLAGRGPAQEVRRVPGDLVRDALAGAWGRSFGPRMLPRAAPGRASSPAYRGGRASATSSSTSWEGPIPPTGSGG
jgi:hypothetical protein